MSAHGLRLATSMYSISPDWHSRQASWHPLRACPSSARNACQPSQGARQLHDVPSIVESHYRYMLTVMPCGMPVDLSGRAMTVRMHR
jgi:hypothetical protein